MKGLLVQLLLLACACLPTAPAGASQEIRLHIQPQPLGQALNSYAMQTNQQVMFPASDLTQRRVPGLEGWYTRESALTELLAGTPLAYEFVNERTVAIRPAIPIRTASEALAPAVSLFERKPSGQSAFMDSVFQRLLAVLVARTLASASALPIAPLTLLIIAIVLWYSGRLLIQTWDSRGRARDPAVQAALDAIARLPTEAEQRRELRKLVRALIRRAGKDQPRPVVHRILDIIERRFR